LPAYINLAIEGLVAENRTQEAADLVAFYPPRSGMMIVSFQALARALAKAGDLRGAAALIDRMAAPLAPAERDMLGHDRVVQSVKALAQADRIDDAIFMMMQDPITFEVGEMQTEVARAFARRGDAERARRVFDLARKALEHDLKYAGGSDADRKRWSLICLSAMLGDADAVKRGLEKLGPDAVERVMASYRPEGYAQLISSLIEGKQFALALEVAKTAPDTVRDRALLLVNEENAAIGRIDDARAVLPLFGKEDAKNRAIAVRNIAVAMTKAGKLVAAVEMVAQVSDLWGRRAALFAIAQALPQ
jgi:hypothetical protein